MGVAMRMWWTGPEKSPRRVATAGRAGRLAMIALCVVVSFPATAAAEPVGFNTKMLAFNRWMLRHVLEPVARGYNVVMPKWGQRRVTAFFANIDGPRDIINSALQAKFNRAGAHSGRLLVNTTMGLVGFFDVGLDWFGWEAPPETFDETLGVWRVPLGPYLVLPLLGDSSPRAFVGTVADGFMNPLIVVLPLVVDTGPPLVLGAAQFTLRGTNLLASQMPEWRAPEAQWDAYRRSKFDFPPYEIGRETFIADEADRVAE